MSTVIRPELSVKSKYWISKHRYYELKHFCMQYPLWKKALNEISNLHSIKLGEVVNKNEFSDSTARCAEAREYYLSRVKMLEDSADETDPVIGNYILKAVINSYSYDCIRASESIPCCKDVYYELYRKFFYILSQKRE